MALKVALPCGDCQQCMAGRYNLCESVRSRSSAKAFPHFRARCRMESIILQRGVIGEFIRDIEWGFTKRFSIPEDVSLDLEALLEPLGVAIHASRRAQLHKAAVLGVCSELALLDYHVRQWLKHLVSAESLSQIFKQTGSNLLSRTALRIEGLWYFASVVRLRERIYRLQKNSRH